MLHTLLIAFEIIILVTMETSIDLYYSILEVQILSSMRVIYIKLCEKRFCLIERKKIEGVETSK